MSVDIYYSKKYDSKDYNCAHLVAEVWLAETGQDISEILSGFTTDRANRRVVKSHYAQFKRIAVPQSPCIVLFQSPRVSPHVGIYLRNRVLHISRERGVRFDDLALLSKEFKRIGYFLC